MDRLRKLIAGLLSALLLMAIILPLVPVLAASSNLSVAFEVIRETPVDVVIRVTLANGSPQPEKNLTMTTLLEGLSVPITSLRQVTVEQVKKESYIYQVPTYGWRDATEEERKPYYDTAVGADVTPPDRIYAVLYYTEETRYREVKSNFKNWSFKGKSPDTTATVTLPGYNADRDGWGGGVLVLDFTINTGLQRTAGGGWGSKGVLKLNIDGTQYFDLTNSSWWDSDWQYRMPLSFNATGISTNLIDCPVRVALDNTNFDFSKAQTNGEDICFVDADNITSLAHEKESWDAVAETAILYTSTPQIDANSNYTDGIYMYYGNAGASDTQNPDAVWDPTGAVAVWHLAATSNNGSSIYDSTSNNYTIAPNGPTWSTDGRTFDGINDRILAASRIPASTPTGLTCIVWFKRLGNSGGVEGDTYHDLLGQINGESDQRVLVLKDGTGILIILGGVSATKAIADPTIFNQVGMTWNGTLMTPFVNGVTGTSVAVAALNSGAGVLRMGWTINVYFITNGIIGEVRIYDETLNADELLADNMNRVDTLLSYGGEQGRLLTITTIAASDLRAVSATLSANITNAWSTITTRGFQWGLAPATYISNWTEAGSFGTGVFSHEITELSENTTYYFRPFATNTEGTGYGGELSFTTLILRLYIIWEYNTVFTDQGGSGITATPSFRTVSSDADVTAALSSFAPISTAIAPPYSVSDAPLFITGNITASGSFTTGNITAADIPGVAVIDAVAQSSGTPSIWIWGIIGGFTIALGGLFISWMVKQHGTGPGELIFRILWASLVLGLLVTFHIFDWWMLVMYLFIVIAPAIASRHQEIGASVGELNLIGFLSMAWVGLTAINRMLEGAFLTSVETSHLNSYMFTQEFTLLSVFKMPIINFQFFTQGIPSLLRWDYSFFGGNAQIIQYLLYSLTAIMAFIIFGFLAGLLTSYFSRVR